MDPPAVRTQGLTKDYGAGRGVFDLDLEVRRGEVFGFLGPNGAGKTTTIRLLMDFLRPTRGSAHLLGQEARRADPALRRRIGYLPGELRLYGHLTGRRLLRYQAALLGDGHAERTRRLAHLLRAELDRPLRELSGGNRQKVGILLSLRHAPELLLWDEPTSGLDPLMQRTVHRLVREHREAGGTLFLSSHILPEVEQLCDRVGIVREGRLLVVEDLARLRGEDLNRLVFTFEGPPPAHAFQHLPGVTKVETAKGRMRVWVDGSVDAVIKEAARHTVLDVDSQDPDLEEAFMRYYARGPAQGRGGPAQGDARRRSEAAGDGAEEPHA